MKSISKSLLLLLITVVTTNNCPAQLAGQAAASSKPNIIFILADDQGWNGTSVQMHPDLQSSKSDYFRTPCLERLAKNGMRFSNAYAPGPMCSPSRASFQTGKSPALLGMTNVGRYRPASVTQRLLLPKHSMNLPTKEITIGEVLGREGYTTAWFGKWHLGGSEGPGAHGYDAHDGATGNADGDSPDPNNPKDIFGITDRGLAFMEQSSKAGKPFYLQLWHYAVHGPVQSRDDITAAYKKRPAGKVHRDPSFASMTEDLDTSVGKILDKLEELEITDNTYVVYMSDHGFGGRTSNSPLNKGKGTLWEGGMRVPFIVAGPGVKKSAFCQVPIVGWDLFPTFCEWAGVSEPLPAGIEGASLRPLLSSGSGELKRPHQGIAFHFPHYGQQRRGNSGSPHSTLRLGNFKLIKRYETNQLVLFNLQNDLGESKDLSKELPEQTEKMHQILNEYLKSVEAGIPILNPEYDPNATEPIRRRGRRPRRRGGIDDK